MNFVAIDFETANAKRYSACPVALTVVRENKIVDEFYSLINPPTDFHWRNIQVHGIHAADVVNSPTFTDIWGHINSFFDENKLVIAHNAPFDNSVIKSSLDYFGIERPKYLTLDTVKTSKQFFPDFPNHKLDTVCNELNITLDHHHNALDDSQACANILLYQASHFGIQTIKPFVKTAK